MVAIFPLSGMARSIGINVFNTPVLLQGYASIGQEYFDSLPDFAMLDE